MGDQAIDFCDGSRCLIKLYMLKSKKLSLLSIFFVGCSNYPSNLLFIIIIIIIFWVGQPPKLFGFKFISNFDNISSRDEIKICAKFKIKK